MYLKSLVLKGFKSFADRSVLTLEPGITAVVGPNGSGKSNISDAVLWVLGERNAKNLRGQVMEDVIFAGSSARKSVGVAEVTLVLDNSDGSLPVDFEEVAITRRMFRNGESEYLINNTVARRMDVLDILHDSGLGTGTHSIISQGHLDSILQSKPEDRRDLIEEAAGVLKHKQRKAKSMRKLEQMDNHLARAKDVVTEVERQLGPLQRKARRAVAYKEVSADLAALELKLAVDDLRIAQAQWEEAKRKQAELDEKIANAREHLSAAEKRTEELDKELRDSGSGVGKLSSKVQRLEACQQSINSIAMIVEEKLHSAETFCSQVEQMLERNDARFKQASTDEGRYTEELAQIEESLEKARTHESEMKAQHDEASAARANLEQLVRSLSDKLRTAEQNADSARKQLDSAREKLAADQGRLAAATEKLNMLATRQEEDSTAAQSANDAYAKAEAAAAELGATVDASREKFNDAKAQRDSARRHLDQVRSELNARQAELAALEEVANAMASAGDEANAWAHKESSFAKTLKKSLASEVSVDEAYRDVVETLLGDDITSFLVDDESTVQAISREFNARKPKGAFSILSKAKAKAAPCTFTGKGEQVFAHVQAGECSDYAQALLADAEMFESFDQALAAHLSCAHTSRLIARTGEIIYANGKITFGRSSSQAVGVLKREDDIRTARAACTQLGDSLSAAEQENAELESLVRKLQDEMLEASQKLADAKGELSAAKRQMDAAAQKAEKSQNEKTVCEQQIEALHRAINESQPKCEQFTLLFEQATSQVDKARAELASMQDSVAPARNLEAERALALSEAKMKTSQAIERRAFVSQSLSQARITLEQIVNENKRSADQLVSKRTVIARATPLITLMNLALEASVSTKSRFATLIDEARSESREAREKLESSRNNSRAARDALDALTAQTGVVMQEKGRLEATVKHAIDEIVVTCETPLETALEIEPLENRQAAEDEAARLRKRITNMGTINPEAAEEYEQLKQRYDYLKSQLDDLSTARISLMKIDRVIDARMKDDFSRTFEVVNKNFSEIFATLFPGGQAQLQLVDPDDLEHTGVEVVAQPRGKKITKMMLMSGGEKSLVALALLFAVYRTRSTPFYILDEVEAALDDSNLRRLTLYLNELRNTTQLIMITHQRRTMELANVLFGVSMQGDGVTKVVSQRLDKALQYAE